LHFRVWFVVGCAFSEPRPSLVLQAEVFQLAFGDPPAVNAEEAFRMTAKCDALSRLNNTGCLVKILFARLDLLAFVSGSCHGFDHVYIIPNPLAVATTKEIKSDFFFEAYFAQYLRGLQSLSCVASQ